MSSRMAARLVVLPDPWRRDEDDAVFSLAICNMDFGRPRLQCRDLRLQLAADDREVSALGKDVDAEAGLAGSE